ncbi:hypothetical protein LTR85_005995 [Meristemomyces frigidus]|nr:hypothetical protein LTR85_005995 [Meristemomyces frigidus]
MAPMEEMQTAMINRSIRTIKAELEYLCDAAIISPQTLSDLLNRIPPQTALHAPLSVGAVPTATAASGAPQPPASPMNNLSLQNTRTSGAATNGSMNEKVDNSYFQQPTPSQAPPPAYGSAPPPQANWPPLAQATALYAYTSGDAGDLELQPNDHVTVTEYMNAEWWKGKSTRTGQEGIFPRSYVKLIEEKADQQAGSSTNYGNAPLAVSGMGNGDGRVPGKGQEMGKKFGKKLGNAAVFGAECVEAARSSGAHADHGVIRLGPVTQKQKETAQTALQALSSGKNAATVKGDAGVRVPQSLSHLEKARLYYGHGNKHTSDEDAPYTAQMLMITAFKTAHYAADIRDASSWQLRDPKGTIAKETLQTLNAQVGEDSHVSMSGSWEGVPVEKVARLEDRRKLRPVLAAAEVRRAAEAMREEGDEVGLTALKQLARELGVDLGMPEAQEVAD